MQLVPIQAVPNQQLQCQLGGQATTLNIRQLAFGLFIDVYVGTTPIILGVICQNLNRVVRSLYLGFSGDFVFIDTSGSDDPIYTGLGDRFQLIYLSSDELPVGQG